MLMGFGSKVMGIYDIYVNWFWPYASYQNAVVTTLIIGDFGDKKCPTTVALKSRVIKTHRLLRYRADASQLITHQI